MPQVAGVIGLSVPAFDVNITFSGFCHALRVARSLIAGDDPATVLVAIGADRILDIVDPDDRTRRRCSPTAPVR